MEANITTKVLFVNFGGEEELCALKQIEALRTAGIPSDIYPESAKMKKQMEYANRRGVPYVVIIGESERAEQKATVKNMHSGEQATVTFDELANYLMK